MGKKQIFFFSSNIKPCKIPLEFKPFGTGLQGKERSRDVRGRNR